MSRSMVASFFDVYLLRQGVASSHAWPSVNYCWPVLIAFCLHVPFDVTSRYIKFSFNKIYDLQNAGIGWRFRWSLPVVAFTFIEVAEFWPTLTYSNLAYFNNEKKKNTQRKKSR